MTILGQFQRGQRRARGASASLLLVPLLLLTALMLAAVAYIVCVLWPRWPAEPVALDSPQLPITVAGTPFNIPPAAIRVGVQRHPGALERVDLAFLWPSLKPADQGAKPITPATLPAAGSMLDRIFITIAAAGNMMAPTERLRTIYPRYAASEPTAGPDGLAVLAFREATPYQGEDLIYDAMTPEDFLVRCSRNGAGATPGTCLWEERVETADIVVRFPRDWLKDWRPLAGDIAALIKSLRPSAKTQ
jgi:hypothetical protein